MEIKINIAKRHLYIFSAIVGVLIGILTVNAFDSGGPASNFGHSVDEVDWSKAIQDNLLVNGIVSVKGQGTLDSDANYISVGDLSSGDGPRGLKLRAADSDAIKIEQNGNVGIGTTPGAFKLDVQGNERISGTLRLNGAILSHVTGSSPGCTSGGIIIKKWSARTCTGAISSCTTIPGWSMEAITCLYCTGVPCTTNTISCTANTWSDVICVN